MVHEDVRRRFRRLLKAGLCLLATYLGLCAYLANGFLHPKRTVPALMSGLVETRVNGTPVWATPRLAAGHPSHVVFVLAHGYRGNRASWTDLFRRLQAANIDAVAPAMPGQDASPFQAVGFGPSESHIVLDCAQWARANGARRVVGLGVSLGGAATWLASEEDPKALDGVISDSAYARFDEASLSYLSRHFKGENILLRPVIPIARLMTGIDPARIRPIDAATAWRGRPALVVQGAQDTLIVPSNGERLAAAAGCPLWRVEDAGHTRAYAKHSQEYARRVIEFAKGLDSPGR